MFMRSTKSWNNTFSWWAGRVKFCNLFSKMCVCVCIYNYLKVKIYTPTHIYYVYIYTCIFIGQHKYTPTAKLRQLYSTTDWGRGKQFEYHQTAESLWVSASLLWHDLICALKLQCKSLLLLHQSCPLYLADETIRNMVSWQHHISTLFRNALISVLTYFTEPS